MRLIYEGNMENTEITMQELPAKSVRIDRNHRLRSIFIIAIPVMIQNLVHHLQMMIDRAFLGNFDSAYLSVIGNVMVPFNALGLFLISASTGLTILVAQNIGAKKFDKARDYAESSFIYSTILSSMIFVFWFFAASQVFSLLGVSGSIKDDSVLYVTIISVSMIFMGVDVTAASVLSGAGYTSPIMVTGLIKNAINIILDYALIFGKFGFPQMGLAGAAWATVIANITGSVILLIIALKTKKLPFQYTLKALLNPKWKFFSKTMSLGLPSGFESFLWFIGQLALVKMINSISPESIGVLSLVQSLNHLALFVYLGFARSAITMVGQYWGANEYSAAKKTGVECMILAFIVSILWSIILLVVPKELSELFTKDQGIVNLAIPILRLSVLYIIFQVVNIIMGHAIRGTGDTKWMLYSQIFGTLFVIITSYIVIFHFKLGLIGVIAALTCDELLRGAVNYRYFMRRGNFNKLAEVYNG